jgi:hypothetical protein
MTPAGISVRGVIDRSHSCVNASDTYAICQSCRLARGGAFPPQETKVRFVSDVRESRDIRRCDASNKGADQFEKGARLLPRTLERYDCYATSQTFSGEWFDSGAGIRGFAVQVQGREFSELCAGIDSSSGWHTKWSNWKTSGRNGPDQVW